MPESERGYRPTSAEAKASRAGALAVERTHARRARRIRIGFLVAMVLSALVGFGLGAAAHTTPAEIAAREGIQGGSLESLLKGERRRVLQELWRMEALELVPASGGGAF